MNTSILTTLLGSVLAAMVQDAPTRVDVPAALRPYVAAADGLEGSEQALTLTVATSIGSAAERKLLGSKDADGARTNWNYILREALQRAAGAEAGTLFGGGLFYDAGERLDPATQQTERARTPEFRLQAQANVRDVLELRRLVGAMYKGLSKVEASTLEGRLRPIVEAQGAEPSPWLMHAQSHLAAMAAGDFPSLAAREDDVDINASSWEEFCARIRVEVEAALVSPARATLPEGILKGRDFRFEGEFVIQVVDPESESWEAPDLVLTANRADRSPTLLIQIPTRSTITHKTRFERATIGVVAGGGHRVIHDGRLPIR